MERIIRCNQAFVALVGADSADAILGRPCWEVVHGTNTAIAGCPLEITSEPGARATIEMSVLGRWVEVITDPVVVNGQLSYLRGVHIIRDITEQRMGNNRVP